MQQYIDFLSNHPYLTAAWVALFLALIVSWIKSLTSSVKQITPTQLTLMVNREDATVIDIRAEADFKKGHITGARHLQMAFMPIYMPSSLANSISVPTRRLLGEKCRKMYCHYGIFRLIGCN